MEQEKYMHWRKVLHQLPELSGQEIRTKQQIIAILQQLHPTRLIAPANDNSLLAEFCFSDKDPVLLFRADMDAIAVDGNILPNTHFPTQAYFPAPGCFMR